MEQGTEGAQRLKTGKDRTLLSEMLSVLLRLSVFFLNLSFPFPSRTFRLPVRLPVSLLRDSLPQGPVFSKQTVLKYRLPSLPYFGWKPILLSWGHLQVEVVFVRKRAKGLLGHLQAQAQHDLNCSLLSPACTSSFSKNHGSLKKIFPDPSGKDSACF